MCEILEILHDALADTVHHFADLWKFCCCSWCWKVEL